MCGLGLGAGDEGRKEGKRRGREGRNFNCYSGLRNESKRKLERDGRVKRGGALSPGLQRNRTNRRYIRCRHRYTVDTDVQNEMYYQVLAHITVDAEKSHHLLSASRRSRRDSAVVQRPGSRKTDGVDSTQCLEA